MLNIFSRVFWPSVHLLWRTVCLDLLTTLWFFFFVLSCRRCLYILEINPLAVNSFANMFSHTVHCLFILFRVSFAVQKLLLLIRHHLFIFVFIVITLGGGSGKILLWFMSESVWPMFSYKYSIVSGLIFGSLIHLEFLCMVLGSVPISFFYM